MHGRQKTSERNMNNGDHEIPETHQLSFANYYFEDRSKFSTVHYDIVSFYILMLSNNWHRSEMVGIV